MMMPTFGAEPRFGTHPIAWAAPAGDEDGFLFDVSCCQVAANKVTLARRLQVKLAKNWVTDDDGAPIDHEHDPLPNATQRMLPFGGEDRCPTSIVAALLPHRRHLRLLHIRSI